MRIVASLLIVVLGTQVGRAEPPSDEPQTPWMMVVPPDCTQFIPPRSTDHPVFWDRWLSLASCLLDGGVPRVQHPFEVDDMIQDLMLAYQPSMLMWQRALDRAPLDVQARAGYHVGLAMVAFATLARRSLAAPDGMTEPDAVRREAILRARLEPSLALPQRIARTAFTALLEFAAEHPDFESNPVHREMVRSAKNFLAILPPPSEPPRTRTVRAIR
jgi:hypothetical protein